MKIPTFKNVYFSSTVFNFNVESGNAELAHFLSASGSTNLLEEEQPPTNIKAKSMKYIVFIIFVFIRMGIIY